MKKLSTVDKAFLLGESREAPMHVANVSLYALPEGVEEQGFLQTLTQNLRNTSVLFPPFGDRLRTSRLGLAGATYWESDPALDMEYHVRHSALPKPGRYRELFNLVSRLLPLVNRKRRHGHEYYSRHQWHERGLRYHCLSSLSTAG
ncbi:MAG: wax ester/triacylglycerol synthase domain-containing protein [Halioglobus sp.]